MIYFYPAIIQNSIDNYFKFYEISYFYNSIYFNTFLDAMKEVNSQNIIKERQSSNENNSNILKTWLAKMDKDFDEKLRSDNFLNLLDKYIDSSLDLFNNNYNNGYINLQLVYHDFFDFYLKYVYSALISYSKELNLANHEIVFQKHNIKLLHYMYNNTHHHQQTTESRSNNILLVIYAQINRFHILDLNPSKSIVRTLLNNGIDVYLLDWGYPDKRDNDLTLKDYIDYIDDAVNTIIQSRSLDSSSLPIKISLLGYCWGGITSFIYTVTTAINQKNIIDKLILMATPNRFQ
jgi:polyhydroxyalkanoate synthase subunit PhaC